MLLHKATSGKRRERRSYVAVVLIAICLLAWLTLWLWERSAHSRFVSHHSLDTVRGDVTLLAVYLVGWFTMVVAMMLPTLLPLLLAVERQNRSESNTTMCNAMVIAGYVLIWTLVGVVIYAGDWLLHQTSQTSQALAGNMSIASAFIPILAGIYQFTPLKRTFLGACRTPLDCTTLQEHRKIGARQWLLAGVRHGLCCIGCCWALMLLMFASGTGSVGWMAGLALVMLGEKWLPGGQRFVIPIGVVLVVWGGFTLFGILSTDIQHHHHGQFLTYQVV